MLLPQAITGGVNVRGDVTHVNPLGATQVVFCGEVVVVPVLVI